MYGRALTQIASRYLPEPPELVAAHSGQEETPVAALGWQQEFHNIPQGCGCPLQVLVLGVGFESVARMTLLQHVHANRTTMLGLSCIVLVGKVLTV